MEPGDYVAVVEVRYSNLFAVSSDIFSVINEKSGNPKFKSNIILLMGIIFASLMILFVYLALFRKNSFK